MKDRGRIEDQLTNSQRNESLYQQERSNSESDAYNGNYELLYNQDDLHDNVSEFSYNDQELSMLIKRPVLTDERSLAQFKKASPYQKPQ